MRYCYIFETYDTPAEHINPMGNVIGALVCELKDHFEGHNVICRTDGGIYKGEWDDFVDCCEGYDLPEDVMCDGVMSEDPERIIYHEPNAWEMFEPDIVDEWWYTLVEVEVD